MPSRAQICTLALAVTLTVFPGHLIAQDPPIVPQTPYADYRVSQPARVTQRMGTTELTVVYNRPVARGRDLFGALVPWDSIWNPGADEATRLEVDEDVLIEGQVLPAGRYSLWAIPGPAEWTLIFSRSWDVPHRPYPEGNEALRLRVRPEAADHMETLAFYFPFATADAAILALHWGEIRIPVSVRRPD
ncbi:MAG: DUF2911 domain-containing protein [Gemmatimonadota bacterium]